MTTIAIDYDGTLVDAKTGEWLDGALLALKALLADGKTKVIIHTCRANWPEGVAQIEAKLGDGLTLAWRAAYGNRLTIIGKPAADRYVDNLGLCFTGDWPATLRELACS